MKVLITGGAGYVGSILSRELLRRGYEVVILDRFFFGYDSVRGIAGDVELIKGDIRWFDPTLLEGVDAVIDLAALSNDPSGELNPEKTLEINYGGRVRVAKLAKKKGVKKYILASSCSVYGSSKELITEDSPVNPLTTYAKAALLAEKHILPLADRGFSVTVFRKATIYGFSYRMRFDLVVNAMTKAFFLNGKVMVARDGTQWRPLVHVRDVADAYIKVLEVDPELVNAQIFNVGSDDQNYQIYELAKLIANSLGLPFNYEWYGSPDKRSYRVSFKKIRDTLNFRPKYTPKEGAREVYKALEEGRLKPDDLRTITVKWYKHLIEMHNLIKEVEIDGKLL